jgi:peptide deformylase
MSETEEQAVQAEEEETAAARQERRRHHATAIRLVRQFPDPALRTPARTVEDVDDEVRELAARMAEIMEQAHGVGLAAPQIGVPLRICVIDVSGGKRDGELLSLVNPAFVEREGMQIEEEGCLSLPGFNATVPRPARAVVRALDAEGRERIVEGTGLLARALQHEIDHLDGVLFIDRLDPETRKVAMRAVRESEWFGAAPPVVKVSPHPMLGRAL